LAACWIMGCIRQRDCQFNIQSQTHKGCYWWSFLFARRCNSTHYIINDSSHTKHSLVEHIVKIDSVDGDCILVCTFYPTLKIHFCWMC
jgi:hypothetical protein